MAIYNYGIKSGFDQPTLDNLEDVVSHAPTALPVKWGSVRRKTLNQATQFNGSTTVKWRWSAISRDDMDTLLMYLGDVTAGSAEVTIRTRNALDRWSIYNAVMANPLSGEDWERGIGGHGAADPFEIEFTIIELTFGEILDEFGFPILDEDGNTLLEG